VPEVRDVLPQGGERAQEKKQTKIFDGRYSRRSPRIREDPVQGFQKLEMDHPKGSSIRDDAGKGKVLRSGAGEKTSVRGISKSGKGGCRDQREETRSSDLTEGVRARREKR